MKKITAIEFHGKDKKGGLLKECINKAVNEHKQVHKGLGVGLELLVLKNTGITNFNYNEFKFNFLNNAVTVPRHHIIFLSVLFKSIPKTLKILNFWE